MDKKDLSYRVLDALRLKNGMYLASQSSDYNYVWLRDSFYEVMPYLNAGCDRYEKTYNRIMDLFHEYEWKIDNAIRHKPTKQWEYIHSRYDAEKVQEIDVEWGHSQHDAIGAVLFGISEGIRVGKLGVVRGEKDKKMLKKLVRYLESCKYWMDADSGMWEEWREVHSSSVGACVAGLRGLNETGLVKVHPSLITRGEETLRNMFPYESADRATDLSQLSLIYPYDIYTKEKAQEIVRRVENNLLRKRGVIRYQGDSYYSSKQLLGRQLPLSVYYGAEAEWTFGLPWLALCHMELGNYEKAGEYLEQTEGVMLDNGFLPELYYASTDEHNGNTPLGWSNALYIIAKERHTEEMMKRKTEEFKEKRLITGKMNENPLFTVEPKIAVKIGDMKPSTLSFYCGKDEVLHFDSDGSVFYRGRLIVVDEDIVKGMKEFLDIGKGEK